MDNEMTGKPGKDSANALGFSGEFFRAPWSVKLKVVTGAFAVLALFILIQGGATAGVGLLAIGLVAMAFSVRGYRVGNGKLTIYRLGWTSRYDLSRLVSAEVLTSGLPGSVRVFGIGGLFAFTGHFWHPDLGRYKAYATDGTKSVLLDFGDERILVTPDSPTEFAAAVRMHSRLQAA
jgi:hypothetical protein